MAKTRIAENVENTLRSKSALFVRKEKQYQESVGPKRVEVDQFYVVAAGEVDIFHDGEWHSAAAPFVTYFRKSKLYGIRQRPGYSGRVVILIVLLRPPREWKPPLSGKPLRLPGQWWRRLLDLEAATEYNQWGERALELAKVLRFIESLAQAAAEGKAPSANAKKSAAYVPPRRPGTTADWMEVWARAEDVIRARAFHGLTVHELAKSVNVSAMQLRRIYMSAAGNSPKAAITHWRMEQARKLLREGRVSVAEVARSVGFSTPQRFSSAFKAHCGQAPVDFAKKVHPGSG